MSPDQGERESSPWWPELAVEVVGSFLLEAMLNLCPGGFLFPKYARTFSFLFWAVMRIELRASCILNKRFSTELHL